MHSKRMRKPRFAEANLGAMVGVGVGAVGGLFALSIARAIIWHDAGLLLATTFLNVVCWLISGIAGWLVGGQLGPRLQPLLPAGRGEVIGGVLGGLAPVIFFALLGWYLVTPH
jgi:hypothetical protein